MDMDSSSLCRQYKSEREEIERHKWFESEKAGRDIGMDMAIVTWIMYHKQKWLKDWKNKQKK